MHIGIETPKASSGEVEIRRQSKRKALITSIAREPSVSPPRITSSSSSSSSHRHTHHHDEHHSHSHSHGSSGNGNDSGHSSDDESLSQIVSAAPSTSRLVDLEDNTDIISPAPSTIPSASLATSSSSLINGPAAGLISVNIDDVRRQCSSISNVLSLSIPSLLGGIRHAPSTLKHTRADDPLFGTFISRSTCTSIISHLSFVVYDMVIGREDREIPLSFLGERQSAARSSVAAANNGNGTTNIHTSIVDAVDVHSHDLDDDFM
jgi:hypothetical protein